MISHSINLFLENAKSVFIFILKQKSVDDLGVKRIYESKQFMNEYVSRIELQKPESAILEELRYELPYMKMLDIGVGAGRTTKHFAGLTKEYVGIDYSSTMIKTCRLKFPQYKLEVADAKNLSLFSDSYFDFAFFSFNGIDAVDHVARLEILREIRRVTRKGGYFGFSAHNLNYWQSNVFVLSKNPVILFSCVCNLLLSRFLNRKNWRTMRKTTRKKQYAMVYHNYKNNLFRSYYVTPNEQLEQLECAGFSNTKAYNLQSGKVSNNPLNMLDKWIYFLAKAV